MISSKDEVFNELNEYSPPEWCSRLSHIPKYRIPLVMKPTPIHPWYIKGIPKDVKLSVKRDDMNGSVLTGNKSRKLEFLLAEAKVRGCSSVITAGSLYSNHCRSTVIAARQVGLDCHLVQRDPNSDGGQHPSGNLLLIRIADPNTYIVPWNNFKDEEANVKIEKLADHILKTTGKSAYCIPTGGSNEIGLHGYLCAWEEMIQQGVLENFDDIVVACGSGGTVKSLAIGNYLTGSKVRLHAVIVARSSIETHRTCNEMLKKVGLNNVRSEDIMDVWDNHLGEGYTSFSQDDIAFCKQVVKTTGIYCDPVYVGKALKGLISELNVNPDRFKGKRILFIHTGGIFGLMEDKMATLFQKEVKSSTKTWNEVFTDDC